MSAPQAYKAAALEYLGKVLSDVGAKPSDRQRAAEAILRAEAPALVRGRGSTQGLTDADLEALLHREGGIPPERGPATGVTETGPIRASGIAAGGPNPVTPGAGPPAAGAGPPAAKTPKGPPIVGGPILRTGGPKARRLKKETPPPAPLASPTTIRHKREVPFSSILGDDVDPCS